MSRKRNDSHSLRQRWRTKPLLCLLVSFCYQPILALQVDNGKDLGSNRPPVFATPDDAGVQPTQIWVNERERLNLKCPLKTNASSIHWLKDNYPLREESAQFLDISAVSRIDSGLYKCYAENSLGSLYSWSINVTVLYLDGFVTDTVSVVTVPELGNFVLKPPALHSSSNVNLSWRWYYQDNEITSNNDYYITLSGALVVGNPQLLAGNYTLQVRSANGPSFFHHFVVKTDQDTKRFDDFRMLYAPEDVTYVHGRARPFTLHASEMQVQANTPTFECVPASMRKNPSSVKWFIDGEPLVPETNGVHIENRGRRLILMSARQFFAGDDTHSITVSCKATTSSFSEVSATAQMQMTVVPIIDRRQMSGERAIPVGSMLRLKCITINAWPRAKISWFFNSKKIPNSVSADVLKINSLEEQNYGVYQCEASNSAGSDIASIWIRRPSLDINDNDFFIDQNDDIADQTFDFVERIEDLTAKLNQDLTLQCITNDVANTRLTWRFNNVQLPSDSRHQSNSTSLTILNVRTKDAGVYECMATSLVLNKVLRASAQLVVRGTNLIEYGPSNQSVLIGTNIRMLCKIADDVLAQNPSLQPEWSRNGQKIPVNGDSYRRININSDGSLSITQVGPDSIGTYKCQVQLGSETEVVEASLQIIERPAMPQNVEAFVNTSMNPAKISVTWKPGFDGNSPLINHLVEMRTLSGGPNNDLASEWSTVVENVPPEMCCSVLVDNLRPSATAEFRVIAVNRFGQGRPSIPSPNITMPQQPPAAAPRDVKGSGRSSSSIIVQWQPPPPDQWNGDILGYTVRYRLAGYPTLPWIEKNITLLGLMHHHAGPPGHQLAKNILIDQLISWRDYEIQVAAFNDLGPGVYSKPIEVAPLESAPMQAPQNVEVEVLNSTDIRVSFDPLDQQMIPGVNLGYKIELWRGVPGSTLYKLVRVFPDYSRLRQQIGGLEKFGRFNLTVLCFTAPGDGPRSEALEFQTEEDVPGPVASINFDQVLYSSVLVQWDPPAEPNGHIIKYILRHWETTNQMSEKNIVEVGGHETNATIEGLRASTQYSVDLQALTQIGAGPRTEAKFESGIPPELPSRPTAVVVSDVGSRSAVIQFIPGFDGHSYIKNWIVEAKVGSSSIFTTLFTISAPKARSFTVERLRPNTRYQFRLIAENIRGKGAPSEATRWFETRQTQPETAPEKLYAEPLSDERVQLVWSPLPANHWNGDPLGYLVMYRAAKAKHLGSMEKHMDANDVDDWKEIRTSNPKASELTLLGLDPYTTYQIKLFAENTFGRSEASDTVSATTYESSPSEGPPNVRAELEQQLLRVQWDDLSPKHKHGQILGFRVQVKPDEEALQARYSRQVNLIGADIRSAHFTNLRPYTDYRCFVYARTIVGEGPASKDIVLIRTPEARSSAPSNVRFGKVTTTSANLLWAQPAQPNGRIIGFEIRYRRLDQPESQAITTAIRPTLNEFSANSLVTNTTYVFSIRAETQAGWGPDATASVFTYTQRASPVALPPAPQPNPRHAPSAHAVWLKWPPTFVPGESLTFQQPLVRAVEVEYQRANDAKWTLLDWSVSSDVNEVQIDGLLPNQPYRARIRFITDSDRSQWSPESEWIKTLEMEPESAPTALKARPYESSSILLEWQALDPIQWNSDRIGYRVLYRIYPSNESFLVDELPMSEEKPENGKMQHVIKKLASFHHYIVQVQSYNSLGASPTSTPPAFVYVGYSIPKQEIRSLKANVTSSTSIHVQWDDWVTSEDDVISGYRIRYTPLLSSLAEEFQGEGAGDMLEEMMVSERNEVQLTDLRKFTEYQIAVAGYNRAGDGQASVIRAQTLEDTPGSVGQLQFADILLDSVNVSWAPPAQPNGRIIGYTVTYRTYRMPEEFRKEIQEKTTTNWLLASRLDEQTTYSFSVQALTAVGAGSEVASNVTIGYNPGAPAAPVKLQVLPEETTFMMRWQNGVEGQSPIKGHLIQAKRIGIVVNRNQSMMFDDETNALDSETVETKSKSGTATQRRRRQLFTDAYAPRHPIGEWITITHILGGHQNEYRLSYRQLEPASFYVFRVYARNDLGVGLPSAESERLQVPAILPDDPFYTKWWFLVIVGLLILMVIIVFVATLCVTSANAWKKEAEKQKKEGAYDTHQLPDDFVVSYELQSKQNRLEDRNITPRPGTHTSWLSNEGMGSGNRVNGRSEIDPAYGSIGSGINGALGTGRSVYGSTSVYQALATDQLPVDGHRNLHVTLNDKRAFGSTATYAGLNSAYTSRRQLNQPMPTQKTTNYWTHKGEDNDYVTYGEARLGRDSNNFAELFQTTEEDQVDAELQAERAFASHYQSTNPLDETYRATWRRTREQQAERARTPSRHASSMHYPAIGAVNGCPSRPESASTSDSPANGSEVGAAGGSASTQSAKSVNFNNTSIAGIQLRNSNEFDSPKHVPYQSVAHGYSSFV